MVLVRRHLRARWSPNAFRRPPMMLITTSSLYRIATRCSIFLGRMYHSLGPYLTLKESLAVLPYLCVSWLLVGGGRPLERRWCCNPFEQEVSPCDMLAVIIYVESISTSTTSAEEREDRQRVEDDIEISQLLLCLVTNIQQYAKTYLDARVSIVHGSILSI